MDWLAAVLELLGLWLLGTKCRGGFLVLILGSVFWIWIGQEKELWGLVVICGIMALVNIRNYRKWREK